MMTQESVLTMAKWIAGVVAGLAAIWTVLTWGAAGMNYVHTEPEAAALKVELKEHHNQDTQLILQMIADEKKADRVQRNQRELVRLERDLVGGKYANEDEKEFMKLEIEDLKKAIHCDLDGICQ